KSAAAEQPATDVASRVSTAIEAFRAHDVHLQYAPVAQLDRAAASGAVGREFESLRARQFPAAIPLLPRSRASLGISPAGSRFAHARKTAQVRISPGAPVSRLSERLA